LLLAACVASAQSQWDLEVVGGFAVTSLSGDTDASFSVANPEIAEGDVEGDIDGSKLGFLFGALVTIQLNEYLGVQSGLVWTRKGGDGEAVFEIDSPLIDQKGTAEITVTLDYVEIPIVGVLRFPVGPVSSLRLLAGPVLGFNSNAEFEASAAGASSTTDIGDQVKSVDVGGVVGAGFAFPTGLVNLQVDVRYTVGLSNVNDTDLDFDIKNRSFSVLAGVGIPLTG
jgi:hypothetical protein